MCVFLTGKMVMCIIGMRPILVEWYQVHVGLNLTQDQALLQQHQQMPALDVVLELL
jgi:hypothetical protein